MQDPNMNDLEQPQHKGLFLFSIFLMGKLPVGWMIACLRGGDTQQQPRSLRPGRHQLGAFTHMFWMYILTIWRPGVHLTAFRSTVFPDVSCSSTDGPFTRKLCSGEGECCGHGCYRQ